jgi:hypothetical protein
MSPDGSPGAEPSFGQQIALLNSTLRAIEVRLALGRPPEEGFEEFTRTLDDMRHRLWALLSTTNNDYRGFQERFRIRRAIELCRGLGTDLKTGAVSGRHPELPALLASTVELEQSIEHVRTQAE